MLDFQFRQVGPGLPRQVPYSKIVHRHFKTTKDNVYCPSSILIDHEQALRLRRRKDKAAFDFDSNCLICSFQVSLESITTPRYLTNSTSLIGTSLM